MILLTLEWEECICATSTPSQRLVEEAWAQQAHPSGSAIPEHYKDFADVFSEEAFTHLPPRKAWDHAIELHPNAKLPRGRLFPLSPTEQRELDEFLRENLVNRQIHLLKSLIGAPVFFIKKKEGSLPSAGLPGVEQDHSEELLPTSIGLRCAHQAVQCGMVHHLGPPLGLQQCPTEGRG